MDILHVILLISSQMNKIFVFVFQHPEVRVKTENECHGNGFVVPQLLQEIMDVEHLWHHEQRNERHEQRNRRPEPRAEEAASSSSQDFLQVGYSINK
jgi:hypothetical protein